MVEALRSFQPDAIYGCHVKGDLESGKISCQEGPVMAALKAVEFTIHGQGGHGSRPDLAANPLFAGTAILNDIAIAWANQVDVRETVTLGITKFQCGEALNVISDHAEIGGTLRYFNQAAGEAAYETLMNIARNVAQVHKCRVEEKPNGEPGNPPVVNDPELAALFRQGVEDLYPGQLVEEERWFGSNSFACYRTLCPTLFSFLGIKNPNKGTGGPTMPLNLKLMMTPSSTGFLARFNSQSTFLIAAANRI